VVIESRRAAEKVRLDSDVTDCRPCSRSSQTLAFITAEIEYYCLSDALVAWVSILFHDQDVFVWKDDTLYEQSIPLDFDNISMVEA
jgi:hypothetical protein